MMKMKSFFFLHPACGGFCFLFYYTSTSFVYGDATISIGYIGTFGGNDWRFRRQAFKNIGSDKQRLFFISLARLLLEIQPGCEFLGSFGLGGAVSRWIYDEGEGLAKTRPDNGNGSMVVRLDSVAK